MERRFQDPLWWDQQVKKYGYTPRSADYSEKSHKARLAAFAAVVNATVDIASVKIADIPCGVGLLLDALPTAPRQYVGVDFSDAAIKVCLERCKGKYELYRLDLRSSNWTEQSELRSVDLTVCCGLFCFTGLFNTSASAIGFVSKALTFSEVVVANFPRDGHAYQGDIQQYSLDVVATMAYSLNLTVELHYGYLPHEFLGVFRK